MLRLFAVLLALLSPAPFLMGGPDAHGSHGSHEDAISSDDMPAPFVLELDAGAMPGERGWFLIPVTPEAETWVEVDMRYKNIVAGPDAAEAAVALVTGSERDRILNVMGALPGGAYAFAEANMDGQGVACCDLSSLSGAAGGSEMRGRGGGGFLAGPDAPVWIGLVATHWTPESKALFRITAYGTPLHAGDARTGLVVESIDLVAEARRAGDNVNLADRTVLGAHGAFDRTWTPEGAGLVLLQYYADGDATARLTVRAGDERVLDGQQVAEASGNLQGTRAGAWQVTLDQIEVPEAAPFVGEPEGYLHATMLYADVDLDVDHVLTYHHPNDDWDDW